MDITFRVVKCNSGFYAVFVGNELLNGSLNSQMDALNYIDAVAAKICLKNRGVYGYTVDNSRACK